MDASSGWDCKRYCRESPDNKNNFTWADFDVRFDEGHRDADINIREI
jgi:hypothetical protein